MDIKYVGMGCETLARYCARPSGGPRATCYKSGPAPIVRRIRRLQRAVKTYETMPHAAFRDDHVRILRASVHSPLYGRNAGRVPQREALRKTSGLHPRITTSPSSTPRRWCTNDGRLCEYSRPRDRIRDQRVAPKTTGFQDRLYEMKGVPQLIAQRIEDDFMSFVDNHAAAALGVLETDASKINGDQNSQVCLVRCFSSR